MKVLFLSFQENSDVIGVKYLHALVASKGYDSSILLLPNDRPANVTAAMNHVVNAKPDVLCVSAMTYEFSRARSFLSALREHTPICPVVFGGIHATACPESCLDISDVVVRGEGENTLLALLESFNKTGMGNLDAIEGISFRRNGEVVHTPVRPRIEDLDALPHPRHLPESMYVVHRGTVRSMRDPAIFTKYARYRGTFLSVVSSRGCPFACHYCCNSVLKALYGPGPIRRRSPEDVVAEIAGEVNDFNDVADSGKFLYVNFQDDCFMTHPIEWIQAFSEKYAREVGIPFIVRTSPRHITEEKLMPLKKAGLRWVFAGLQTGSDRVNSEVYGRNVTVNEFLDAAHLLKKLNIPPWYDVILDNPYETEEEGLETVDILLRTPRPYQLDIFSLDFFPGTELRRKALEDRIPIPQPGEKSYTEPEPTLINRFVRMSPTLPRPLVRFLVRTRGNPLTRAIASVLYVTTLFLEPFTYIRLVHIANDYSVVRTSKVLRAFYATAIGKLFLRRQG